MAALASDWLRHFRLLLWNRWMEFNETWQEARSQRPLPSLCFSGRSVNKNVRLGWFLKEVAHCTQVHDMWPFGPLVIFLCLIMHAVRPKSCYFMVFNTFTEPIRKKSNRGYENRNRTEPWKSWTVPALVRCHFVNRLSVRLSYSLCNHA